MSERSSPTRRAACTRGEIERRSIWGEATAADARALVEEGIEVMPLPPAFEDRN